MNETTTTVTQPALLRGKFSAWIITIACVVIDQWSKHAAFEFFEHRRGMVTVDQPIEILDAGIATVSIVKVHNTGMAFGLIQDVPNAHVFLAVARGAAVLVLTWLLRRTPPTARIRLWSIGVLLAGALGNLADNLFNRTSGHAHAVRDFIHLSRNGWTFPAFNFADFCVTIGGLMLLITLLRRR